MGARSCGKMESGTGIEHKEREALRGVMIGSGNVAWHIAQALERCGAVRFEQVWSRTLRRAEELAEKLEEAQPTDDMGALVKDAEFYLVSVSDDALRAIAPQFPENNALWAHTSGSVEMEVLKGTGSKYGVFYPLQTFTRGGEMDVSRVPMFIEGADGVTVSRLKMLAHKISEEVFEADSELRGKMHIAAVYACNFTNYMWTLADDLLKRQAGLNLRVLAPLLYETLHKALSIGPEQAQTGPARRGDRRIMAKHEAMVEGTDKKVYELLSDCIMKRYGK